MRFTKFHITSFKGIKELEFDFASNPKINISTLVGLNESGKTTVLEAISYLQDGVKTVDAYKLIPRDKSANFTGDVSVTGHLEIDEHDQNLIEAHCQKNDFYLASPLTSIQFERRYTFQDSEPIETKTFWTIALTGRITKRSK